MQSSTLRLLILGPVKFVCNNKYVIFKHILGINTCHMVLLEPNELTMRFLFPCMSSVQLYFGIVWYQQFMAPEGFCILQIDVMWQYCVEGK